MNPNVLLIDDSLAVRMDLQAAFMAGGYDCTSVATLAVGRAALQQRAFDLIVLDVHLRDGDGVEFIAELKAVAETRAIPAILLSLEADVRARVRGLTTGADDYIGKPYDKGYLLSRANELISAQGVRLRADASPHLLVIDCSASSRTWLKKLVEPLRCSVIEADNSVQGLRLAAELRLRFFYWLGRGWNRAARVRGWCRSFRAQGRGQRAAAGPPENPGPFRRRRPYS